MTGLCAGPESTGQGNYYEIQIGNGLQQRGFL